MQNYMQMMSLIDSEQINSDFVLAVMHIVVFPTLFSLNKKWLTMMGQVRQLMNCFFLQGYFSEHTHTKYDVMTLNGRLLSSDSQ